MALVSVIKMGLFSKAKEIEIAVEKIAKALQSGVEEVAEIQQALNDVSKSYAKLSKILDKKGKQ